MNCLKPDYLRATDFHHSVPKVFLLSCFNLMTHRTSATATTKKQAVVLKAAAAGIGLCLDDFGSGYANLNSILRLPFSVIKMDRSLLFRLCEDETARTFYHNMITTLKAMGYQIVAEGIETKEEADYIQAWNVDLIQGYYYSPPLSEQKLLTLFSSKEETPCESH